MDEVQELIRGINSLRTEVELGQAFRDLPGLAFGLFLFEGVDQLDSREEADLSAVMFDGLNADGRCNVVFASARAANEDHVLRPVHELAAVQGSDSGFIDLARGEVEAREVLVAYLCRSKCSFKPLGVRRPRGFSLPMLNADGVGYRSR